MRIGVLRIVLADTDHEGGERKRGDDDQGFGDFHSGLLRQKLYEDGPAHGVTGVTETPGDAERFAGGVAVAWLEKDHARLCGRA